MLKKNFNYVLLLFLAFTFLSCYNIVTEMDTSNLDIPSIGDFSFGKLTKNTTGERNSFYILPITEYNVYDTVVLSCTALYIDLNFNDEIPTEKIPQLNVKVTTLNGGDTEYYRLFRDESFKAAVFITWICPSPYKGPHPAIRLMSFMLPVAYEPSEAIVNDGLLTTSPKGDRLFAEVIFQNKKYTDSLDVKPM